VAVQHLDQVEQLDALAAAPRLLVLGHDIGPEAAGAVRRAWPSCAVVEVAVGEVSGARQGFVLPGAWSRLTAHVETAFAPPRLGRRLALIGAHGGAGTSCLAVALARRLTGLGTVRLAALNPVGAPLGSLLGLGGEATWAGAVAAQASGRPLQPAVAFGVETLAAAGPELGVAAWQVRRVIETWEASGGLTVFDAGRASPYGGWRCASWADQVVVVARAEIAGLAAARDLKGELAALELDCRLAVREVPGGLRAADAAQLAGFDNAVRVGRERGLAAGLAHGMTPGDRAIGPLAAAARTLAEFALGPAEAGSAPALRPRAARLKAPPASPSAGEGLGLEASGRHRPTAERARPRRSDPGRGNWWPVRRRAPAPAFNPAAFAEEW
jgi:pilus assembly protein CpaE